MAKQNTILIDDDIMLCCANCIYADSKRCKDNTVRCKKKHKYMPLEYYCIDYDFGNTWINADKMIGE
ncbi:MAG: hypothetical protein KBT06_08585 [Prevotellaceae bacterium]|nr:hypothetical protein [Candidatus Colivivens equi]